MRLWGKIANKNTYLSILIIVLGNMFLLSTVEGLIIKYIHLTQPSWLLNFLGMFIITLVLYITTTEIFEL